MSYPVARLSAPRFVPQVFEPIGTDEDELRRRARDRQSTDRLLERLLRFHPAEKLEAEVASTQ